MKKLIAVTVGLLLAGCAQLAKDFPIPKSNPMYDSQELTQLINNLDHAGYGSITTCEFGFLNEYSFDNVRVEYVNSEYGKYGSIYTADRHRINTLSLIFNKKDAQELSQILLSAIDKAKANKSIEWLNVGNFKSSKSELSLNSSKGDLTAHWSRSIDKVTNDIDFDKLAQCITQLEPFIS